MATLTKNVIDSREAGYIDKLPLQQLLEQIFGQHDFGIKVRPSDFSPAKLAFLTCPVLAQTRHVGFLHARKTGDKGTSHSTTPQDFPATETDNPPGRAQVRLCDLDPSSCPN